MPRLRPLLLSLFTASFLQAADSGRLLAFAVDNQLSMAIGKFEPRHGWIQATNYYVPPNPGDAFTLYGPEGKAAVVTITDRQEAYSGGTFASWSARVSPWNRRDLPFALAVAGALPPDARHAVPIPLNNPEYMAIVSKYLKSHGLHVEQPILTQAFGIPQEGHGSEEAILVAHSDASALSAQGAADIYAVALLWRNDLGKEKILPLASQTSFKPAGRTIEEHERLYGTRDFLRVIAAEDIDGDGEKDFVLYDAKDDATEIDVFTFKGRRLQKVLSAYKANYN